jgi:hypothetical protein
MKRRKSVEETRKRRRRQRKHAHSSNHRATQANYGRSSPMRMGESLKEGYFDYEAWEKVKERKYCIANKVKVTIKEERERERD